MISIVIKITGFSESPRRAISSILKNLDKIRDVHIIYPNYSSDDESMYKGWKDDKKIITAAAKAVFIEPSLDSKNFDSDDIVVEIPPNCELKSGAFSIIENEMKNAKPNQTHLGLSTVTKFSGFSLWYGFFIVLYTIDWIWNRLFERNKLIQYTDVKARFIIKKGKVTHFPEKSIVWRFWNVDTIPKIFTETAVIEGGNIIAVLNNHSYMTIGLWLLIYGPIWFVVSTAMLSMPGSVYSISMWIFGSTLAWLTTKDYVKLTGSLFYVLAFPFYFILFPILLIYSKNTVPKNW
jgi:hypothetical protein